MSSLTRTRHAYVAAVKVATRHMRLVALFYDKFSLYAIHSTSPDRSVNYKPISSQVPRLCPPLDPSLTTNNTANIGEHCRVNFGPSGVS